MAGAVAAGASPLLFSGIGPFPVETRARPRLVTDTARIREAVYRSRFVADGARLTEARLTVSHRGPLRWTFALPPGSELIECSLAGAPVNPLIAPDGRLEIPLPAADETSAETPIALRYTDRGAPFGPVEGRLSARLPATPLFVEELTWSIALPPGYEATAFEGNVEAAGSDRALTFRKRLLRDEALAVEIYYRKQENNL